MISDALFAVVKDEIPWPDHEVNNSLVAISGRETTNEESVMKKAQVGSENEEHCENPVQQTYSGRMATEKRGYLGSLFKAYSSDFDRCSGTTTDNFDRKNILILDRCDQADVFGNDRSRVFSIMLTANARQFYLDALRHKNLELEELVKAVKKRFYTPERSRALVSE